MHPSNLIFSCFGTLWCISFELFCMVWYGVIVSSCKCERIVPWHHVSTTRPCLSCEYFIQPLTLFSSLFIVVFSFYQRNNLLFWPWWLTIKCPSFVVFPTAPAVAMVWLPGSVKLLCDLFLRSDIEAGHCNDAIMIQYSCFFLAACQVEFLIIQAGIPKISQRLERAPAYVCKREGGCMCRCEQKESLQSRIRWSSLIEVLWTAHTVNLVSQRKMRAHWQGYLKNIGYTSG